MLQRKVITRYWCTTCDYSFEDDGVTDRALTEKCLACSRNVVYVSKKTHVFDP